MVFWHICLKWNEQRAQSEVYDLWTVYQIRPYQPLQGQELQLWDAQRTGYLNKNSSPKPWANGFRLIKQVTGWGSVLPLWWNHHFLHVCMHPETRKVYPNRHSLNSSQNPIWTETMSWRNTIGSRVLFCPLFPGLLYYTTNPFFSLFWGRVFLCSPR